MPSDSQFTDHRGRPLAGKALDLARAKQIRELEQARAAAEKARAEAEQARAITRAVRRRTARAVVAMAAAEARRTGQAVPDLLRARLGAEDAEHILADAGVAAPPAAPRAPVQSAGQSATAGLWASSPDHDPRVVQALVRGAGDGELSTIRAEVAAEYASRAAERQARQQSNVLWRTGRGELLTDGSPAVLGASYGPSGAPVQTSRADSSVQALGTGTEAAEDQMRRRDQLLTAIERTGAERRAAEAEEAAQKQRDEMLDTVQTAVETALRERTGAEA